METEKDGWMMEGAADGTDDEPRPSKKSQVSQSFIHPFSLQLCAPRESTFRLQFIIFIIYFYE